MTTDEVRYVRAPGFVARRVAGETLLVQTSARSLQPIQRSTDLLVLNGTGEQIWNMVASPVTIEGMAQYLIQDFDVDPATARADAESFVASMVDLGAILPVKQVGES
ncbi:MAG: PqqD family protein [Gemmatimonadaceae bacterium]|nr:PqqD family protein [Gemmatimonadaceae bacterium]